MPQPKICVTLALFVIAIFASDQAAALTNAFMGIHAP
jgi:hypothetical protein